MNKLLVFVFIAFFVLNAFSPNFALAQTCTSNICTTDAECATQCTGATFFCDLRPPAGQHGIGICALSTRPAGAPVGSRPAVNIHGSCPGEAIDTAIGCIPVNDTNAFAGWFLGWAIGISGGLALLLIVFSGFQIMTASGDPQRLQSGRELLTAAISGLILIIFSMFLLRLIGVQILHLPGITG